MHARSGEETTVETYLHVREDALQLYGFASADERELFELLLGVSGIGPKVALAIVSGSPPAELRRAIARDDLARFEAIPGIGRKTAQRVVMELKDKLAEPAGRRFAPGGAAGPGCAGASSGGRWWTPSGRSRTSTSRSRWRSRSGRR